VTGQESSEEKLRTAVVNIQELFRNYYKSQKTQEEINLERARIQKDHNDTVGRLRSMDEGLRQLEARLQQPELAESEREVLLREKGLRLQEREALDRQRFESLEARHGELNKKMMVRMENLLEEIREIVAERAEKTGFDLVLDVEGLNTSQVPFLLHAKDATDITPMILKELNKDAPPQN
jgi:Skp family chaperone for outer membrane proteins